MNWERIATDKLNSILLYEMMVIKTDNEGSGQKWVGEKTSKKKLIESLKPY